MGNGKESDKTQEKTEKAPEKGTEAETKVAAESQGEATQVAKQTRAEAMSKFLNDGTMAGLAGMKEGAKFEISGLEKLTDKPAKEVTDKVAAEEKAGLEKRVEVAPEGPSKVSHPDGSSTEITYGADGRPTKIAFSNDTEMVNNGDGTWTYKNAKGETADYEIDVSISPDGTITQTSGDGMTRRINPDKSQVETNSDGQVTEVKQADGDTLKITNSPPPPDGDGKPTEIVDAKAGTRSYRDGDKWYVEEDGKTTEMPNTEITIDENGNIKRENKDAGTITTDGIDGSTEKMDLSTGMVDRKNPDGSMETYDGSTGARVSYTSPQGREFQETDQGKEYTVKPGDNPWNIVRDSLKADGNPNPSSAEIAAEMKRIEKATGRDMNDTIYAGDKFVIPPKGDAPAEQPAEKPEAPAEKPETPGEKPETSSDKSQESRPPAPVETDEKGNVTKVTYKDGESRDFTYKDGALDQMTDKDGTIWKKEADGWHHYAKDRGELKPVVDAEGKPEVNTEIRVDSSGNVTFETESTSTFENPDGYRDTIYKQDPKVESITEWPNGTVMTTYRDGSYVNETAEGKTTVTKDGTTTQEDKDGNVTGVYYKDGTKREFEYDSEGNITKMTQPNGTSWTKTGEDTWTKDGSEPPETWKGSVTIDDEYNHLDILDHETGIQHSVALDGDYENPETGTIEEAQKDAGPRTEGDQLKSVTYPDGTTRTFEYDENGDVTRITHPDGSTWRYTGPGDTWTKENSDPPETWEGRMRVDPKGNFVYYDPQTGEGEAVSADGKSADIQMSPEQMAQDSSPTMPYRSPEEREAPPGPKVDSEGNLREIKFPDGTYKQFEYQNGELSAYTDAQGNRYVKQPDGSWTPPVQDASVDVDGIVTVNQTDSTTEIYRPDGSHSVIFKNNDRWELNEKGEVTSETTAGGRTYNFDEYGKATYDAKAGETLADIAADRVKSEHSSTPDYKPSQEEIDEKVAELKKLNPDVKEPLEAGTDIVVTPATHPVIERRNDGKPTEITYPDGSQRKFEYDSEGNVTRITQPDGSSWTKTGEDTWTKDGSTPPQIFEGGIDVQPDGTLFIIDPETGMRTGFNAAAIPDSPTDPYGTIEQYMKPAEDDNTKDVTYPDGTTRSFEFDADGNVVRMTHPDGSTWHYTGPGDTWTKENSDPPETWEGRVKVDEQGNFIYYDSQTGEGEAISADGKAGDVQMSPEQMAQDSSPSMPYRSPEEREAPPGPKVDSEGNLREIKFPDGTYKQFEYQNGELSAYTDAQGNRYVKEPDGSWSPPVQDASVDVDGNVTINQTDGTTEIYRPDGSHSLIFKNNDRWELNEKGEVTSETTAGGRTYNFDEYGKATYDARAGETLADIAADRVKSEHSSTPDYTPSQEEIDEKVEELKKLNPDVKEPLEAGTDIVVTPATHPVIERRNDGKPTEITYPDGSQRKFEYDGAGNVTKVTQPDGSTWTKTGKDHWTKNDTDPPETWRGRVEVDARDQLTITDIEKGTTQVSFVDVVPDEAGNPYANIEYARDQMPGVRTEGDKVNDVTYPDGTKRSFEYDKEGAVNRVTNPDGTSWTKTGPGDTWTKDGTSPPETWKGTVTVGKDGSYESYNAETGEKIVVSPDGVEAHDKDGGPVQPIEYAPDWDKPKDGAFSPVGAPGVGDAGGEAESRIDYRETGAAVEVQSPGGGSVTTTQYSGEIETGAIDTAFTATEVRSNAGLISRNTNYEYPGTSITFQGPNDSKYPITGVTGTETKYNPKTGNYDTTIYTSIGQTFVAETTPDGKVKAFGLRD